MSLRGRKDIAIIPARGGSRGIPRKNVLPIGGKPLIAWTIEAARAAESVDRVVVSTDDPEIGRVAEAFGADVVWRPAELSGDQASSESALLHALEFLERAEGYDPDILVFLQCTSPLTQAEDIDGTVRAMLDADADTALSVAEFHYFLWRRENAGEAVGINHDKSIRLLRQNREPQYQETGAVYAMRASGFREARHRFFGRTALYVSPPDRVGEIDDPIDMQFCELLIRQREQRRRERLLPGRIRAIVFDFDGVLSDNRVFVLEDGREAVVCDRGDGMGVEELRRLGVEMAVISKETNPVVQARCRKLGLECAHGVEDKLTLLKRWAGARSIKLGEIIFLGNDVNDIECMQAVGCGVAVADATPKAKAAARIELTSPGGRGAVRELADMVGRQLQQR